MRLFAALALVVYLLLNANAQPYWNARGGVTAVGALAAAVRGAHVGTSFPPIRYWFVRQEAGGWVAESDDTRWSVHPGSFAPAVEVTVKHDSVVERTGLWSPVVAIEHDGVSFVGTMKTIELTTEQRCAMLAAIDALEPGRYAASTREHYAAGGATHYRILWPGVLNDLTVIAAIVGVVLALKKRRSPVPA